MTNGLPFIDLFLVVPIIFGLLEVLEHCISFGESPTENHSAIYWLVCAMVFNQLLRNNGAWKYSISCQQVPDPLWALCARRSLVPCEQNDVSRKPAYISVYTLAGHDQINKSSIVQHISLNNFSNISTIVFITLLWPPNSNIIRPALLFSKKEVLRTNKDEFTFLIVSRT